MRFTLTNANNDIEKWFKKLDELGYNTENGKLEFEKEHDVYINIDTLEELVKLSKSLDRSFIFDSETIIIYDGYIE